MMTDRLAPSSMDLRPCPFCGCEVELAVDEYGNFVIEGNHAEGCLFHDIHEYFDGAYGISTPTGYWDIQDAWNMRSGRNRGEAAPGVVQAGWEKELAAVAIRCRSLVAKRERGMIGGAQEAYEEALFLYAFLRGAVSRLRDAACEGADDGE